MVYGEDPYICDVLRVELIFSSLLTSVSQLELCLSALSEDGNSVVE